MASPSPRDRPVEPAASAAGAGESVGIRAVRRVFPGGVAAIDRIDLEVAAGEFVALIGPSGCGKSTLLRIVAGLDRASEGDVLISGGSPTPSSAGGGHRIAYVFQDAHLLPWRSVAQNVALPLELRGAPAAARHAEARAALAQVGLADAAERYPAELSGGMRMRASLARALVTRPRLLLLDEPFAALDEITRQRLDDQLRELWLALGMTVLFVTHSIAEAAYLAQRAVVLSARPARIVHEQALGLPRERSSATRTSPAFVAAVHALSEALERSGA
jgi:NitT/TauT family transport system ATP-binding protein